jgi:hypothetical protein
MTKYLVYLEAVATIAVEVEADSQDEAVDLAYEQTPSRGWDWPDMGDWYFPGDQNGNDAAEYIEEFD